MKAIGKYVVLENLDKDDMQKSTGGIYLGNVEKPHVGHFKVLSVGPEAEKEVKLKENDTVWALLANVSNSSNFESKQIGVIKYENIMCID